MSDTIYFDHNATTPVDEQVFKAMEPYYKDEYGNASSMYSKGRQARTVVDEAREVIAGSLGTEAEDIVFTSGGTESDNLAIKGVAWANRAEKKHIITSSTEHAAVLSTCKQLEKDGFELTYLPVDKYGIVSPQDLKKAIKKDTSLVTIMHANNETGTIAPIAELAKVAKDAGVLFHTDAVQSFGKMALDIDELGVDLLSVSAHKIYGPKGVGALFIKKGVKLNPLSHGGHHERNLRAGTENVAGIAGFGKAVELAGKNGLKDAKKIKGLRDALYKGIESKIEDVSLNGHPEMRLPNTLNISFKFIEGESIMLNLDFKGICVSTGSACTSGTLDPSHVLTAMGIPAEFSQGSIRFSLGKSNTQKQVDYCLKELPAIIKKLRSMSPLKNQLNS